MRNNVTFLRTNRSTLDLLRRSSPGRVLKPMTSRKSPPLKKISSWAKSEAVTLNSTRTQTIMKTEIITHHSVIIWMTLAPIHSTEMCTKRSLKIKMEADPTNWFPTFVLAKGLSRKPPKRQKFKILVKTLTTINFRTAPQILKVCSRIPWFWTNSLLVARMRSWDSKTVISIER